MNIRQQFTLNEHLDPFTLLKVCQALREISCGELLELIYEGHQIPDELFKVLPAEEYEIIERELSENPQRCRIVIQKRKAPLSGTERLHGGWCCS